MATFELPDIATPTMSPRMLLGAASPLWAYFGAATAGGVAWWWMTRWTHPQNLEAMFGRAAAALQGAASELTAPVLQPAEAAAATAETATPGPVGGEAAPISPIVEAIAAAESEPAPVAETTPDPVEAEPAKARIRKPPTLNGPDFQA